MTEVKSRYENLDYLRGLCALSIMIYHYSSWVFGKFDSGDVLGKLGVYGVSMFYVLSGLTMYLVYFKSFSLDKEFFRSFYIKRIFRIYPLMWLVFIISFFIYGSQNSVWDHILQFSGLFSVLDWNANIPAGMWSIGNELSFYLMLPFIFFFIKKNKALVIPVSLIIFGVYCYYAFVLFDKAIPIASQDYLYKNPLCQAGLFFGGILIGYFFKEKKMYNKWVMTMLFSFVIVFVMYPVQGNVINIIAGTERIIYTLLCFGIALSFLKADFNFIPKFIKSSLTWLGDVSYSVYLLHPHVFALLSFTSLKIRYVLPLAIIFTFITSFLVYKYFETPARNIGVRLSSKKIK